MPPDAPSVQKGNTIDRYEILAELARGGMGTVLLARVAGAGGFSRLYAVKLLHKHLMYDSEFVDMLLDEARIAARIHHPNAVAIHEVGFNETHGYYVVMDYVEGVTLWDVNQHLGPGSPQRVKICTRIVYDALMGLECAHTLNDDMGRPLKVVHRDMSPQNILVGVDGIARVTDFGIAKAAARITGTTPGQVKGKLAYMAPEQARGKELDHRVDIFATGAMLWEMLTGQRLFKRNRDLDTIEALLTLPIPTVREKVPGIPETLDSVCMQALVRDPTQRFGSARAMAVALENAARSSNLFADAHEVGVWVRGTFARAIETRREAIRQVANITGPIAPRARGKTAEIIVPAIPEVHTITPQPAETLLPSAAELDDEWEKHSQTVTGPPRVKGAPVDPMDLMKTTAMPSDAARPPALKDAIEQYRQQYGQAPSVGTPASAMAPAPIAKAKRLSTPAMGATVPMSPEEVRALIDEEMSVVNTSKPKSASGAPAGVQGAMANGPLPGYYAATPGNPSYTPPRPQGPFAGPGAQAGGQGGQTGQAQYGQQPTSQGQPNGYATPYAQTLPPSQNSAPYPMQPQQNGVQRGSSPSQAPQPTSGGGARAVQIVAMIIGAIALVAAGALVALRLL